MFNQIDDWIDHHVVCVSCGKEFHKSERECDCGGADIYCSDCGDLIGNECDTVYEERDCGPVCTDCAINIDNICVHCGQVCDGPMMVYDTNDDTGDVYKECVNCVLDKVIECIENSGDLTSEQSDEIAARLCKAGFELGRGTK